MLWVDINFSSEENLMAYSTFFCIDFLVSGFGFQVSGMRNASAETSYLTPQRWSQFFDQTGRLDGQRLG
jgi:hypothetical protein